MPSSSLLSSCLHHPRVERLNTTKNQRGNKQSLFVRTYHPTSISLLPLASFSTNASPSELGPYSTAVLAVRCTNHRLMEHPKCLLISIKMEVFAFMEIYHCHNK